ncbi:MAG: ABC transporter permease [Caldilineaceae bacterium]
MSLRTYLLRRLVLIIPLLIGLSLLTFIIARIVPGDPVGLAAGPQATPAIKAALRKEFGLDQPLPLQYLTYMRNLLQGNWGKSLYSRRAVWDDLRTYFPATLELTIVAVMLATLLGVPAGIIAAFYRNRLPDHISRVVALFFVSFPAFWLAMIFQSVLGLDLGWFPIGKRFDVRLAAPGSITGLYLVDSLLQGDLSAFRMALRYITVPALVLSFGSLASITRITRASILDVLERDYVRTAYAKGLTSATIIARHVARNAANAILTMVALEFGWLMAGAVLVETIFDWPGLGLYAVESSLRLDFQPIMGITILYGIVFSLVNVVTDIAYGVLDPRIRYG